MTRVERIERFLDRRPAMPSLGTDGSTLWSYGTAIAQWEDNKVVMFCVDKFYSKTTSTQRNILRRVAEQRGICVVERSSTSG